MRACDYCTQATPSKFVVRKWTMQQKDGWSNGPEKESCIVHLAEALTELLGKQTGDKVEVRRIAS